MQEVPYFELPLRNTQWRVEHVGPQNIQDEDDGYGSAACEYTGALHSQYTYDDRSEAVRNVFFWVNGSEVRLVETGGSNTGSWMSLCFGGNLLPGARLFWSGADKLTLVCATANLGYIFRVTFRKPEQASSFFDESVKPQVEQLNFRATGPRAVAFGCEMCPTAQGDMLCAAVAEPGGKCWLVKPGYEPYELTGVHGMVGRMLTPVRSLWGKGAEHEVVALQVLWTDSVGAVQGEQHEANLEWSVIGTCSDDVLRLWSGGQCHETAAAPGVSAGLELVGPGTQNLLGRAQVACSGHSMADLRNGMEQLMFVGYASESAWSLYVHTVQINQLDGSCQWAGSPVQWQLMQDSAEHSELVSFHVGPRNELALLVRCTRIPAADSSHADGPLLEMTSAMECIMTDVSHGAPAEWQLVHHNLVHQGQEWRQVGFSEMNVYLQQLGVHTPEVLDRLSQPGWCLDISEAGCQLKGDLNVCEMIRADPSAYRAAVRAGVAAALLGLPAAAAQLRPIQLALNQLQSEASFVPQLSEQASAHEITAAVMATLSSANEERECEIATKLAVYTRQYSAELCHPLSLSVARMPGGDCIMVLRRDTIGLLLDVGAMAVPAGGEPTGLEQLLHVVGNEEVEHALFSEAPTLQDIHHLLLQHVSVESRLQLLALIQQFGGNSVEAGFQAFLEASGTLIASLSQGLSAEASNGCDWTAPDTLTIGLARRVLHQKLCLAKRLALVLTFVLVPNVHRCEQSSSQHGCVPQVQPLGMFTGSTGRTKQQLVEVMRLLHSLFNSQWLSLQRVLYPANVHQDGLPEPSMFNTSRSTAAMQHTAPAGEQSVIALYLQAHRAAVLEASLVPAVPVVGQMAVSLAAHLSCVSVEHSREEPQGHRLTRLCTFLHQSGEHRTLAGFLKLLGDQADSRALLYLYARCCLRFSEDHRASMLDNRLSNNSDRTVQIATQGSKELGLTLHRSTRGLVVSAVSTDGAAAGLLHEGELIVSLNGQSVAQMSSVQFGASLQASHLIQLGLSCVASMDAPALEHLAEATQYLQAAAPIAVDPELLCAHAMLAVEGCQWYSVYSYYMNSGQGVIELLSANKAWDGVVALCHDALAYLLPYSKASHSMHMLDDSLQITPQEAHDKVLQMLFGASLSKLKELPTRCTVALERVLAALNRLSAQRKKTAVRQLVKALVPVKSSAREIQSLCSLPLVGLEDQVEQVLWEEARQHDSSYYDVLHAYLSSRRLYRNVAAAALEKAQRLLMSSNKNAVEALLEQAGSYAAAANALQLVQGEGGTKSGTASTAETGGQYILCDYRELASMSKRKRNGAEAAPDPTDCVEHKARVVITLDQIHQWGAVTRAYVALAYKSVYASAERHAAVLPPPSSEVAEIVPKLLQYELYETAVELSAAYGMSLVPVFQKLATHCISLQLHRQRDAQSVQPSPKRQAGSAVAGAWSHTHNSQEWKLLYRLLNEYDFRANNQHGSSPSFQLHAAVLECVLAQDSRLGFPVQLLHTFRSCVERSMAPSTTSTQLPESSTVSVGVHVHFFERTGLMGMHLLSTLLGLAVKHHTPSLLHEAAILVQDALRAHRHAANKLHNAPDGHFPMAKVWFPFDRLDRLMSLLEFHGIQADGSVPLGQDICARATLTQDIDNISAELALSAIHSLHA